MKPAGLFCPCLLAALLSACGDPALETPTPASGYRVETGLIDTLARPVWSVEVADFDGDGLEDLLLSGHRGAEGERLYLGGATGLEAPRRVLRPTADRHHCSAGDVNGDALPDLYCTTGVDRGIGMSPNELWLNALGQSPGGAKSSDGPAFVPAGYAHGAEEPTSRGRLAAFFRLDAGGPQTLLSTVWGERNDDQPNASRIWQQRDGVFERLPIDLPAGFGGRCLAVFDMDGDGTDEVLACAQERGLYQLYVIDLSRVQLRWLGTPRTWWWGVDAIRSINTPVDAARQSGVLVAAVGGDPDIQFVELQALRANGEVRWRRRLDCRIHNPANHTDIYCAAVLLHDMNNDGHPDVYITRRRGWMLERQIADMDDLIALGPTFKTYVPVPAAAVGLGYLAVVVNGELMRLGAGESWGGLLEHVRLRRTPG